MKAPYCVIYSGGRLTKVALEEKKEGPISQPEKMTVVWTGVCPFCGSDNRRRSFMVRQDKGKISMRFHCVDCSYRGPVQAVKMIDKAMVDP
jgi:predicted RNA-binding Zn-ribbon protein involved in translation (DUF1610 family)